MNPRHFSARQRKEIARAFRGARQSLLWRPEFICIALEHHVTALDWAVAMALGKVDERELEGAVWRENAWLYVLVDSDEGMYSRLKRVYYSPSTDWSQGGPIIERMLGLQVKVWLESKPDSKCEVHMHNYEGTGSHLAPLS